VNVPEVAERLRAYYALPGMSEIRRWTLQRTIYEASWEGPDIAAGETVEVVEARSTIYGVWEDDPDATVDGCESLIALFWDREAAEKHLAEAPTYNAGSAFTERAVWIVREHEIT
jgi:hypothetical protein